MSTDVFIYVAAVFVLAGTVKGVIGLGLPTVSMGLLAIVLPPVEAAALLIVPSLLTNVWQMFGGPCLGRLVRRLAPMQIGIIAGTWAGAGWLAGDYAGLGSAALGIALVLYALTGLANVRFAIPPQAQLWLGPLTGAVTGLITAATGVFVIPAVPYLQAIGLEKEELVQALGLCFTVSTVALAVNLSSVVAPSTSLALAASGALAMALIGMGLGQVLRQRMHPTTFRRCFFGGLLALGIYLAARAMM